MITSRFFKRMRAGIAVACFLPAFLLGCATKPSQFYILHAVSGQEPVRKVAASDHGIGIGVGPVSLPQYLNRTEIVTRTSLNALELAEFHRWAQPLEEDFTRVLAENLSRLLATDRVAVFPDTPSGRMDYQVEVDVVQFEGTLGGRSVLSARWTLFDENKGRALVTKRSDFMEPAASESYEALVAAQSRTVGLLSREIAEAIRAFARLDES